MWSFGIPEINLLLGYYNESDRSLDEAPPIEDIHRDNTSKNKVHFP